MADWIELLGRVTTYVLFGLFAGASVLTLGMIAWRSLRLPARHALEPIEDVEPTTPSRATAQTLSEPKRNGHADADTITLSARLTSRRSA